MNEAKDETVTPDDSHTAQPDAVKDSELQGNLSGKDLSAKDLRGTDFRGKRLVRMNFQGADLRDADLRNTNCTSACFDGAHYRL
jgi:uncharacterized protein YjbI with pentapeptide repeats